MDKAKWERSNDLGNPMKTTGVALFCLMLAGCYSSAGNAGSGHGDTSTDGDVHPDAADGPGLDADAPLDLSDAPGDTPDTWTGDPPYDPPPEIPDDSPCCVLVGDPVMVSGDEFPGGPIDMVWNGLGWGVTWGAWDEPVAFRALDMDGVPVGPLVGVDHITSLEPSIEWGGDRYGIVGGPIHGEYLAMALLDGEGGLLYASPWTIEGGSDPNVDWWLDDESWLIAFVQTDDRTIQAQKVARFGELVGTPVVIGSGATFESPVIVAHKDRTAIAWPMPDGIWYRSFEWDRLDEAPPARPIVTSYSFTEDTFIDAVAFGETTFIAYLDGLGSAMVLVVDAAMDEIVAGPIAAGETMIGDRRPGLAPAPSLGAVGMCFEIGPGHAGGGGNNAVGFRLLDVAGDPLGEPLMVTTGIENIGDCVVGWTGSEFVVAYWRCGSDTSWGVWTQRVRPAD